MIRAALHQMLPPIVVRGIRAVTHLPADWDIRRRTATCVEFHNGARLELRDEAPDHAVVDQVFAQRDYDLRAFRQSKALMAKYEQLERPLILDCGANIGASALWFAHAFPRAKVVAVEPEPGNVALLRRNARALSNVEVVAAAVAGRPGELAIEDPGGGGWAMRTKPGTGIPARTVVDLVDKAGGEPFILKIDIEGFEADVFAHPTPALDAFPLMIVELHDWMLPGSASSRPFLRWHAGCDRDFIYRGENVFSFRNDR